MLQRAGGNFPLTADANFGPNFGLVSLYFDSRSANIATAGTLRLASADPGVAFRNNANSGNLILTTDTSDNLLYNGHIISTTGTGPVTSITGTANQVIASSPTGAVTLSLPQSIGTTSTPTFQSLSITNSILMRTAAPVIFQDGASSGSIMMEAPGSVSNYVLVLPPNAGSSGQFLRTDGAGTTTWVNAAGGGTINTGGGGQIAYYASTGTTISENPALSFATPVLLLADGGGGSGAKFQITGASSRSAIVGLTGNSLSNVITSDSSGNLLLQDTDNSVTFLEYVRGTGVSLNTPLNLNSHKITSLTNGSSAQDAVAFNQLTTGNAITAGGIANLTITDAQIATITKIYYVTSASQTLATSGTTTYIYNVHVLDTLAEYNDTTGVFAPTVSGIYCFMAQTDQCVGGSGNPSGNFNLNVIDSTASTILGRSICQVGNGIPAQNGTVNIIYSLVAGHNYIIQVSNNNVGSTITFNSNEGGSISIFRLL